MGADFCRVHAVTTNCLALSLVLTPLLAADAIAQTGAEHLLAALASEPALSIVEDGARVGAACPLGQGLRVVTDPGGVHHHSPCGCT